MNRCILIYHENCKNSYQESLWFESFADALKYMRRENFGWKSWAIHHIGKARIMAQGKG